MNKIIGLILLICNTASASYPDGTKWIVSSKTCNESNLVVMKNEKIQFVDSYFVRTHTLSEDVNQYCNEGIIYTRLIKSFSTSQGIYTEESVLTPGSRKTQCTQKTDGKIISSQTFPINGPEQALSVSLSDKQGQADVGGTNECPHGNLRLKLVSQ